MRNNPDGDFSDEPEEGPVPEPLTFDFEEPELLDADMLEMLAYPESKVSPTLHSRRSCIDAAIMSSPLRDFEAEL